MNSLNILIVEDDLSFALELELLVQNIGYQAQSRVDNSSKALESIMVQKPDLILMDIDINGLMSGMEIAEQIQHLNIPILFITSYKKEDLYERSKLLRNSLGFVIKPVKKIALRSAIELAIRTIQAEQTNTETDMDSEKKEIYVKKKNVYHKVLVEDILYIQASDNHVIIYTEDDKFLAQTRLGDVWDLVKRTNFLKTHRSYIVNLKKVNAIDLSKNFMTIGEDTIPISRSVKPILREKVKLVN